MQNHDTIAAIATGTTNAGISIIRISGTDAFSVADAVFLSKKGKITALLCTLFYRADRQHQGNAYNYHKNCQKFLS